MSILSRSKHNLHHSPYKRLLIMLIMMLLQACSTAAPQTSPRMDLESTEKTIETLPPEPSPTFLLPFETVQITPTQSFPTGTI